jgi:hypothetical protein
MLNTLSEVKLYLGVAGSGDDVRIEQSMDYAQSVIESYVGYALEETTYTDEKYSTDGDSEIIVLSVPNVSSGDTFEAKWDGELIDNTDNGDYNVDWKSGVVHFNYVPSRQFKLLSFTYTAGYTTVPNDLKMIFNNIVRDIWKGSETQGTVSSERLGDYSVSYINGDSNLYGRDILTPYYATLDKYKRYDF